MSKTEYTITYPLNVEVLPVPLKDNEVNAYAGALADFSMLPHRGDSDECLPPRLSPNVSEDLVSKPFESTSDPLKSGIHLHWAMPRCLRTASIREPEQGLPEGEKPEMQFRKVPNRWLVQRRVTDEHGKPMMAKDAKGNELNPAQFHGTKTFYIESDLLSVGNPGSSRAFPHKAQDFSNGDMLHRYIGKLWHYERFLNPEKEPTEDEAKDAKDSAKTPETPIYHETLTAFGYGEPLYGAFYPECRNVFGFHDDLTGEDEINGADDGLPFFDLTKMSGKYHVSYHIVGWYHSIQDDPGFLAELIVGDSLSLPNARQGFSFKWEVNSDITDWGLTDASDETSVKLNARTIFRKHVQQIPWSNEVHVHPLFIKLLKRRKLVYAAQFESASSDLTDASKSALHGLVVMLEENPTLNIRIECHSDSVGTAETNLTLSQKRADNVMAWLIEQGLDDSRLVAEGMGEGFPLDEQTTPEANAKNRRIEIKRTAADIAEEDTEPEYLHDSDLSQAKIALGNTPGQALAALLANLSGDDEEAIQQSELMLDALQLGLLGETDDPDLLSKIDIGMHKAAFQPTEGGHSWRIIPSPKEEDFEPGTELKTTTPTTSTVDLWNDKLQELNQHQWDADQLRFVIRDEQKQLYADWYKFMIAEYNLHLGEITRKTQVNEIREFILSQMNGLKEHFEELKASYESINNCLGVLDSLLAKWNEQTEIKPTKFEIQKVAADRFWSPSEPALLLYGEGIDHSKRYHQKNSEEVEISARDLGSYSDNPHREIHASFFETGSLDETLIQIYRDVWSPLYMDWQVKLYPVAKPHSIDNEVMNWRPDSILNEYNLGPGEIELLPHDEKLEDGKTINYVERYLKSDNTKILQFISGRSILTPNAHESLVQGVRDSLGLFTEPDGTDPLSHLIDQLSQLKILSQNISGFNDALLMQKQVLQLSVFDPLADNHVLDRFTNDLLRQFIGNANSTAPLPLNLFLPIREGYLKIDKLRIVDTFGRVKEWEDDFSESSTKNGPDLIAAESLKLPARDFDADDSEPVEGTAYLPPRLSQPARLNAWILPRDGTNRMESSSMNFDPVCGWFIPNFLDNAIHTYDGDGSAQGILQIRQITEDEEEVVWLPVPGSKEIVNIEDLNPHLKFAIDFLLNHDATNFREFVRITFASLENIEPANANRFSSSAMLMGKPLALMRLNLDLQVKGVVANDQSWEARMKLYDITTSHNHHANTSQGFDTVKFPIRIGDMSQIDDGLVGYFIRDAQKDEAQEFYSPASIFEQKLSYDKIQSLEKIATKTTEELRSEVERVQTLMQMYRYLLMQEGPAQIDAMDSVLADELLTSLPPKNPNIRFADLEAMVHGKAEMNKEIAVKLDVMTATHQIDLKIADLQEVIGKLTQNKEDASTALSQALSEIDLAEQRLEKWPRNDEEWEHRRKMMFQWEFAETGIGDENASPGIFIRPPEEELSLTCNPEDHLELLMLVDPRAPVHITTGILPERVVRVEEKNIDDAIRNIQMTFLTGAVLSTVPEHAPVVKEGESQSDEIIPPSNKMLIPTLKEDGVAWGWLENRKENWVEFASHDLGQPTEQKQDVDDPITLREGWLKIKKQSE